MINSLPSKFEKNILGVMPDTREKEIIADIAEKKNMLMLTGKFTYEDYQKYIY